jgi:hypothetical protein
MGVMAQFTTLGERLGLSNAGTADYERVVTRKVTEPSLLGIFFWPVSS